MVVHSGRTTSNDSDTSFPSRVSIFLTITILQEELVLVWLKEPEPPPEPKLAWKSTP